MSANSLTYQVVWNGSRATDPYLCIDPDGPGHVRILSSLTPEERAEAIACAQRHGTVRAAMLFRVSAISLGWVVKRGKR